MIYSISYINIQYISQEQYISISVYQKKKLYMLESLGITSLSGYFIQWHTVQQSITHQPSICSNTNVCNVPTWFSNKLDSRRYKINRSSIFFSNSFVMNIIRE